MARWWRSARRAKLPLRDSKRLSADQRAAWFRHVQVERGRGAVRYRLAHVYPKTIDRINVTQAANRAATRALARAFARSANHRRALSPRARTVR